MLVEIFLLFVLTWDPKQSTTNFVSNLRKVGEVNFLNLFPNEEEWRCSLGGGLGQGDASLLVPANFIPDHRRTTG